jgi:hypothetical protein
VFSSVLFLEDCVFIFFRVIVQQIPPFEYFTGLDNPVNSYPRFVLLLLELAVPHLCLSTYYLLVRERVFLYSLSFDPKCCLHYEYGRF